MKNHHWGEDFWFTFSLSIVLSRKSEERILDIWPRVGIPKQIPKSMSWRFSTKKPMTTECHVGGGFKYVL